MVIKLSVVIITYNEEKNIARTLRAATSVADEIVVLDSYSTDNTANICASFNVCFFQQPWKGYANAKNYANTLASYDWILSLDADEELSSELIASIQAFKQREPTVPTVGIITRLPNYCGFWIRYSGWNPDKKVRLFNRKWAFWQGEYIHEKVCYQVPVKEVHLHGFCYHYTVHTLEEHMEAINKFSSLQVQELADRSAPLNCYHLIIKPLAEFIRSYIVKGGFRDGWPGFIVCSFNAFSKFLKYAKYWLHKRTQNRLKKKISLED
ncbi:MAG: glycosyltransferase family 2 protein [Bacteroidia bacterium]|nr:glycosyltransferase family 2 protein [Bacteroidia bacterium]